VNSQSVELISVLCDDVVRVKTVQTMEELRDLHKHFVLYYGHEVAAMQAASRAKERELRAEARRTRQLNRRNERTIIKDDGEDDEDIPEEDVDEEVQPDAVKLAVRSGRYAMCRKARLGKRAHTHVRILRYRNVSERALVVSRRF